MHWEQGVCPSCFPAKQGTRASYFHFFLFSLAEYCIAFAAFGTGTVATRFDGTKGQDDNLAFSGVCISRRLLFFLWNSRYNQLLRNDRNNDESGIFQGVSSDLDMIHDR